tara:strand:- start:1766 stop:1939 length:174 start_codon:yes stop_codon:yes gene_type:complete
MIQQKVNGITMNLYLRQQSLGQKDGLQAMRVGELPENGLVEDVIMNPAQIRKKNAKR